MRTLITALALLLLTAGTAFAGEWPGIWKVQSTKGIPYYITLTKDGRAGSTLEGGFGGSWVEKDGKAYVTFASGWKAVLSDEGGKITKTAFRPGKAFTDNADSVTPAERVNAIPQS